MGAAANNFAQVLSTVTILSCMFLKVPQIMSMRAKKSAEGIIIQALIMEVVGFSIMTLYNYTNRYAIMTYLEYPIILLQVYVMFYHVLMYENLLAKPVVPLCALAYVSLVSGFMLNILPKDLLSYMMPLCPPLSGFAKISYMYGIIKAENADAVSLTTWVISISTNLSRIFTVYVDSADWKLMANFFISSMLSVAVLITALYYKRQTTVCDDPRHQRRKAARSRVHTD
ncbi:unnamed protein product [Chrysodeixis includens]|uniref:PQ-loop repeat-containing protein 3 n=1 Tax=Chrysodeixis includens TaxID=689277 RepID=A0A9P0BKH1_CHRIL|nr:unnamed protein product [Chrysodeixis includens]